MKIKRIYGFIPVPVFYTDKVKEGFAGVCVGPWVKIRPEYKHDEGLLQHELTHAKQWWRTLGIHGWLVLFRCKKHIFKSEVEAYAVQVTYCPEHLMLSRVDLFAGFIADKYGLDVTREEAKTAILNELEKMGVMLA